MLYFIMRSFELDNDKAAHKNQLRKSVYKVLSDVLETYNIEYNENTISYNEYGKPFLKKRSDVYFNITHCHELAVCAVENTEVGVDAENIRVRRQGVLRRAFSEREKNITESSANPDETFFRIWTLKESFVKALGIGISYPLKTAEFLISDDSINAVGCDGFSFSQIIINGRFVCSLCRKKAAENRIFRIQSDDDFFNLDI